MMFCEIKIGNNGIRLIEVVNINGVHKGMAGDNQVFEYRWAVYKGGETTQRDARTQPIHCGYLHHRYGDGAEVLLQKVLADYNLLNGPTWRGPEPEQLEDRHGVVVGCTVRQMSGYTPETAGARWTVRHIFEDGAVAVEWRDKRAVFKRKDYVRD